MSVPGEAAMSGAGVGIPERSLNVRSVLLASADAGLKRRLNVGLTNLRWMVREASGGADAMAQVETLRPEAMLLDHWLPDLEVSEFMDQVFQLYPTMDVLGVDGSLLRPGVGIRSPRRNELLHAIREAQEGGEISSVYQPQPVSQASGSTLEPAAATHRYVSRLVQPAAGVEWLPEMVGSSPAMAELTRMIRLVAPRSATVLIEGETGTGKEVAAKAVHRLSARANKPFAVLNCAAIPEALLEAELFGHTRGAFTGAVQSRTGRIEAAHGGTLFLDEIGEMPLPLQAKMLRFLECGELQRIGDNETLRVDVRVIAATHQDLEMCAAVKTFRLDLYHRLAVFPVEVPALRDRLEDLPVLVEFFLAEMGCSEPRRYLSAEAMAKLATHSWPGNVRELRHVLERGAILAGEKAEIGAGEIRWRARSRSA